MTDFDQDRVIQAFSRIDQAVASFSGTRFDHAQLTEDLRLIDAVLASVIMPAAVEEEPVAAEEEQPDDE